MLAGRLRLTTPVNVPLGDDSRLVVTHLPAGRFAVETAHGDGRGDTPVLTLSLGREVWPFAAWRLAEPAPTFALVAPVHSARVVGGRRDEFEVWLRQLRPIDRAIRLLVTTSRDAAVTLRLEAGPAGVTVGVAAPSARHTVALAPRQHQEVALGAVTIGAWIDLRLEVSGGFPASALGDARDRRQLGVWASFAVSPP